MKYVLEKNCFPTLQRQKKFTTGHIVWYLLSRNSNNILKLKSLVYTKLAFYIKQKLPKCCGGLLKITLHTIYKLQTCFLPKVKSTTVCTLWSEGCDLHLACEPYTRYWKVTEQEVSHFVISFTFNFKQLGLQFKPCIITSFVLLYSSQLLTFSLTLDQVW